MKSNKVYFLRHRNVNFKIKRVRTAIGARAYDWQTKLGGRIIGSAQLWNTKAEAVYDAKVVISDLLDNTGLL